jgi:DNA-directed RNA polymerase specialized sigma24 family protein
MCQDSFGPWLKRIEQGDEAAIQQLWDSFFPRLSSKVDQMLAGCGGYAADGQDVALSALKSFCLRARDGRFPLLADREGLWKLLVTITVRKAIDLLRRENTRRVLRPDCDHLECVADDQPTPATLALAADECGRLLGLLGDGSLQTVVLFKLAGFTNEEIAEKMGCALRTVKRRLAYIRDLWRESGRDE